MKEDYRKLPKDVTVRKSIFRWRLAYDEVQREWFVARQYRVRVVDAGSPVIYAPKSIAYGRVVF